MPTHDSNYLIDQLLASKLSGEELDAFLAGLHNAERAQTYSDRLEAHFNDLLRLEADAGTDRPEKPPAPTN